jgi:hypothetical protein
MKPHGAAIVREHTVQHEREQMDVEIQCPSEALDDHYAPTATIGDAVAARAAPEEAEHRAYGDAADRAAQVVFPREQEPQAMRQTEDPLTDWYVGEHTIDQVRCPLRHAPAATPWTEPAALAREGDQPIPAAGGAPKAGKAAGQTSAPQEVTELLFDQAPRPVAVPQRRGLGAEGEMVPDDPVQDGGCGIVGLVAGRWLCHAPCRGAPRASSRNPWIRRESFDRVSHHYQPN